MFASQSLMDPNNVLVVEATVTSYGRYPLLPSPDEDIIINYGNLVTIQVYQFINSVWKGFNWGIVIIYVPFEPWYNESRQEK